MDPNTLFSVVGALAGVAGVIVAIVGIWLAQRNRQSSYISTVYPPSSTTPSAPIQTTSSSSSGSGRDTIIGVISLLLMCAGVAIFIWGPGASLLEIHDYRAVIPGPNCDSGGASWETANATISCQESEMLITQVTHGVLAGVYFSISGQHFSQDSSITVTVNNFTDNACGGIATRVQHESNGAYGFLICRDGSWGIIRYSASDGSPTTLTSGTTQAYDSYIVSATGHGNDETLSIDGTIIATATDTTFHDTNSVAIILGGQGGQGDSGSISAGFRDFEYKPIDS